MDGEPGGSLPEEDVKLALVLQPCETCQIIGLHNEHPHIASPYSVILVLSMGLDIYVSFLLIFTISSSKVR